MKIKITIRHHFPPIRWARFLSLTKPLAGERGVKEQPFFMPVDGRVNWHSLSREQVGNIDQNQSTLSFDPAIPVLEIYPAGMSPHVHKSICSKIFAVALFVDTKTNKQKTNTQKTKNSSPPNQMSMNRGLNRYTHTYMHK